MLYMQLCPIDIVDINIPTIPTCTRYEGDFADVRNYLARVGSVHNAYIEQLGRAVYKIEPYIILSNM